MFGSSTFSGGGIDVIYSKATIEKVKRYRFPDYKGNKPITPREYHETVRHLKAMHISSWKGQYTYGSSMMVFMTLITKWRVNPYSRRQEAGVLEMRASFHADDGPTCDIRVFDAAYAAAQAIRSRYPDPKKQYSLSDWWNMGLIAAKAIEPFVPTLVDRLQDVTSGTNWTRFNWIEPVPVTYEDPTDPTNLQDAFLFDEIPRIVEGLDARLLGKDTDLSGYWREWLTEHALLEACESFPKLNDNSIQNIMELCGFIKALVVDHRIEIPKSLNDSWLAYRYQYSTTKMDVEEAVKFVRRHMDIGDLARGISCHGMASCIYKDTYVTCRCSINVKPRNVGYLAKVWRALDMYGLTPDFYVIWDSLPYSFMVDWFLPIGDVLSVWDANAKYFSGEFYDLSEPVYSLSYTRDLYSNGTSTGPSGIKCYSRWVCPVPSSLNSMYWFDAPSASSRTVWYRVLDSASIFIGH
jgi:hypothetical protein